MKKLKYLGERDSKYCYQTAKGPIDVDIIVASIYSCEQSGDTSICWLIKSGDVTYPIEVWKGISGVETWQVLLDWKHQPEIEILINPVGGAQGYVDHPIINCLKGISCSWGKTVPSGKIAAPLNLFALKASLEYLEFQDQIDWKLYNATEKTQELIRRGDILRSDIAALAQGIIYLRSKTPDNGFERGSLGLVQPRRGRSVGRRERGGGRGEIVRGVEYQVERRIR